MEASVGLPHVAAATAALGTAGLLTFFHERKGEYDVTGMNATITVPMTEQHGYSCVFRNEFSRDLMSQKGAVFSTRPPGGEANLLDLFLAGMHLSPQGKCVGERVMVGDDDSSLERESQMTWQSYSKVYERATNLASGLVTMELIPTIKGTKETGPMVLLGLYLSNCPEWVIAEVAMFRQGGTIVPIYPSWGHKEVASVIRQLDLTTVVCTSEQLPTLVEGIRDKPCPSLKTIVLLEEVRECDRKLAVPEKLTIISFKSLERTGKRTLVHTNAPKIHQTAAFICTPSGGGDRQVKCAGYTHEAILSQLTALIEDEGMNVKGKDRYLSHTPLAHSSEFIMHLYCLYSGAQIAFHHNPDMSHCLEPPSPSSPLSLSPVTAGSSAMSSRGVWEGECRPKQDYTVMLDRLVTDLKLIRPTIFSSSPLIFLELHNRWYSQGLMGKLVGRKVHHMQKGWLTHKGWDQFLHPVAKMLGLESVRLLACLCPNHLLTRKLTNRLRVALSCPMLEGYGSIECGGMTTITHASDFEPTFQSNHPNGMQWDLPVGVGGYPLSSIEIQIASRPDLNLNVGDKSHLGEACSGRGEILVRGPATFSGYHKHPQLSSLTITNDGWVKSGDMGYFTVEMNLQVIGKEADLIEGSDRTMSLSLPALEATVKSNQHALVQDIFLSRAGEVGLPGLPPIDSVGLVGVVVPKEGGLRKLCKTMPLNDPTDTFQTICEEPGVRKAVGDVIRKEIGPMLHPEASLLGIVLTPTPFIQTVGVLTPMLEINRHGALLKFKQTLATILPDSSPKAQMKLPRQFGEGSSRGLMSALPGGE